MTADELTNLFNNKFQIGAWPAFYEVDSDTYANACQFILQHSSTEVVVTDGIYTRVMVSLGPGGGIMFKNVELLIKKPILEDVKCPECGGKMTSRKNRESGQSFWGCNSYPNCRGTRDNMGRSKAEREEEKAKPREPGRWNVT